MSGKKRKITFSNSKEFKQAKQNSEASIVPTALAAAETIPSTTDEFVHVIDLDSDDNDDIVNEPGVVSIHSIEDTVSLETLLVPTEDELHSETLPLDCSTATGSDGNDHTEQLSDVPISEQTRPACLEADTPVTMDNSLAGQQSNTLNESRTDTNEPEKGSCASDEGILDTNSGEIDLVKQIKADDPRSYRLYGEGKKLERLLKSILQVANQKHIIKLGEKPLKSNFDFADDLIRGGRDVVEAGNILIKRGEELRALSLEAKEKYQRHRQQEVEELRGNPSSESDTEEGRATQEREKRKKIEERKEAFQKQCKSDAEVSGSVKTTTENGKRVTVYVCNVCKVQLVNRTLLTNHLETHTSKTFVCHVCQKQCKTKLGLRRHVQFHTKGPWICSFCGKSFQLESSWSNHENAHKNKGKFKCLHCKKTFTYKADYLDHCATGHTSEKQFKCDLCDTPVKSQRALRTHKSLKHRNRDEKGRRLP